MNYDDERANRTFSLFCIGLMIAFCVGAFVGILLTIYFDTIPL